MILWFRLQSAAWNRYYRQSSLCFPGWEFYSVWLSTNSKDESNCSLKLHGCHFRSFRFPKNLIPSSREAILSWGVTFPNPPLYRRKISLHVNTKRLVTCPCLFLHAPPLWCARRSPRVLTFKCLHQDSPLPVTTSVNKLYIINKTNPKSSMQVCTYVHICTITSQKKPAPLIS